MFSVLAVVNQQAVDDDIANAETNASKDQEKV